MPDTPERLYEPHRLSVDDFHRMGEAGIFAPDARVELLDGEIIDMTPIGTPHTSRTKFLNQRLSAAVGSRLIVSVQDPIRIDEGTELYPDIALLRSRQNFYARHAPEPADVLLVAEVAETSLRYDRELKLPIYARAGIPEVWIVDLNDRVLRVFQQPEGGAYRTSQEIAEPGQRRLLAVADVAVDLTGLFDLG